MRNVPAWGRRIGACLEKCTGKCRKIGVACIPDGEPFSEAFRSIRCVPAFAGTTPLLQPDEASVALRRGRAFSLMPSGGATAYRGLRSACRRVRAVSVVPAVVTAAVVKSTMKPAESQVGSGVIGGLIIVRRGITLTVIPRRIVAPAMMRSRAMMTAARMMASAVMALCTEVGNGSRGRRCRFRLYARACASGPTESKRANSQPGREVPNHGFFPLPTVV